MKRIEDVRAWDTDYPQWETLGPAETRVRYAIAHDVNVPACCWHAGKYIANAVCGHHTPCERRLARGVVYATIGRAH